MCVARRVALSRALMASSRAYLSPSPFSSIATHAQTSPEPKRASSDLLRALAAPWSAIQRRGAKILGSDVRTGHVVQKKGRIYQVLKAQHTQHGRGGANIQVDLRDVDTGNKITERFRTDEALEVVVVEDRSFTFLFQDGDIVTLMDPSSFEQLEVSKELFDDMKVTVQYCDGKPLSASVPQRVTCTVVEAQPHSKGLTAAPQYKRVVLHNGLTVMAPPFIEVGDQIVLNTTEDKYLERAKA